MIKLLYFLSIFFSHEFYVSVSYMEYDDKRRAIQIQKKIFFDDLEFAIKKTSSLSDFDILNSDKDLINKEIESYITKNIQFIVNNKKLSVNYLGHEYINGTINCYFEVLKVRKMQSLIIKDASLFSFFEDQENLIYFETENKLRTIRLKSPNDTEEIFFKK